MDEASIITAVIAIAGSISAVSIYWQKFKARLDLFRKTIDTVDDAIYDNMVTEQEFQAIWKAFKALVKGKEGQ